MTEAYCNRCKCKRNILNPEIKEAVSSTRGKTRFCVGNCESCGNKISVILPKEVPVTNGRIKKLEDEIKSERDKELKKIEEDKLKQVKELDRQKLEKFFESSKENPIIQRNKDIIEVVDKADKKVVSKSYYNLIVIALIVLIIAVGILGFRTYYWERFVPSYNSNVTCDNTCPDIPECPSCPDCSIDCGNDYCNITMPNKIEVSIVNYTR